MENLSKRSEDKAIEEICNFIRESTLSYFDGVDPDVESFTNLNVQTGDVHDLQTFVNWDELYHPNGMTVQDKIEEINEKYNIDLDEDYGLILTRAEESAATEWLEKKLETLGMYLEWDHSTGNGWLNKTSAVDFGTPICQS